MVLHSSGIFGEALECLNASERLNPANALTKFQKANVFFNLKEYARALNVCQEVLRIAPREASVHFLMGKTYKKLGELGKAAKHFAITQDLDPKESSTVKSAMDKLHSGNNEEESEDEAEF
jgi:anaphase-promoting complex subunit 3